MEFAIEILEEQKRLLSEELKEILPNELIRQETKDRINDVTKALDNLTSSSRISGRYYVFTVHNGKLIQDSIALPEMKDAKHYVETMKQGSRGKDQEFIILSNAH